MPDWCLGEVCVENVTEDHSTLESMARDESWLAERVALLIQNHFADVPRGYPIVTRFGSRAQYRFGSIAARSGRAIILVNRLFADPSVPVYVVDGTLAHELAHYAHGYGSGLPKLYADPHRGGVVERELEQRGLGEIDRRADQWREAHWDAYYRSACGDVVARKEARGKASDEYWSWVLEKPGNRREIVLTAHLVALAPRFGFSVEQLPFSVEWLKASRRQASPSYFFHKERILRVHGLLSDHRAPERMIEFEIAYWLARTVVGGNWIAVQQLLRTLDLDAVAHVALAWRSSKWKTFVARNHPLK